MVYQRRHYYSQEEALSIGECVVAYKIEYVCFAIVTFLERQTVDVSLVDSKCLYHLYRCGAPMT